MHLAKAPLLLSCSHCGRRKAKNAESLIHVESSSDSNGCFIDSGESDLSIPVGELAPSKEETTCIFCKGKYTDDRRGTL